MTREQDNFLRICLLVFEAVTPILVQFLDKCLKKRNQNFQSFLRSHQHEIYHMCFPKTCCKCLRTRSMSRRYLSAEQFKVLFDCSNPSAAGHNDYCCSTVKPMVSTKDLDVSLIGRLLCNLFSDAFWDFLPTQQTQDFERFLNLNKHIIFHVCNHTTCCMCTNGNAIPTAKIKLHKRTLNRLYRTNGSHCTTCHNVGNAHSILPCSSVAKQNILATNLNETEISVFQQNFSKNLKEINRLVELRNAVIAHATSSHLSDAEFTSVKDQFIQAVLHLADECGTRQDMDSLIDQILHQELDSQRQHKYETMLIEHGDREIDVKRVII